MTDYFGILNQPRQPWLDPDELKEIWHQRTLQEHPDTQPLEQKAEGIPFTDLNEAYQVLRDPKRRLHHLLSLEGHAPSSAGQAIPQQLNDLFPVIGDLTQRTKVLLDKVGATSNSLSRSLLKPEILDLQNAMNDLRERIQALVDRAETELHLINAEWQKDPSKQIEPLSNLYLVFAYLTRWSAQVDEMLFRLSSY